MKFSEVGALLAIISGLDRRPFLEGAAATWYEVLRETSFEDAKHAVMEYFGTGADELPTLLPGRVRSGAARIKHVREAAERKAIEAPPATPAAQTRSDAFLEAQAAIRAATAAAVANVRRRDPDLKPYKHRAGALTRVA